MQQGMSSYPILPICSPSVPLRSLASAVLQGRNSSKCCFIEFQIRQGTGTDKKKKKRKMGWNNWWSHLCAFHSSHDALPRMRNKGDGVAKDSVAAVKWFHKAAKQGHKFS